MLNKLKAVSAIVIAAYASPSLALGVGSIEMKSHVNQPLDASIVLYGTEGMSVSQLIARMGSMQDFERAGVIREYFLDDIRFSVELDNQGGGGYPPENGQSGSRALFEFCARCALARRSDSSRVHRVN